MLPDFTNPADWLPWAFASLMGLSILIYVILDGFDLGVGILFPLATPGGTGPHDRLHRPVLGRQRDLARAGRGPAPRGLPGRTG
jgi:hypothetical protein